MSQLATAIPGWVDLDHLAGAVAHGYGLPIPAGQASEVRAAAALHHAALRPCEPEEGKAVLMGLRSSTILQGEHEEEARATLKMLRVHLADVPLDILEAGCRAYCNQPGRRFFPKSAGELRQFINPLMRARQARAFLLKRLAEQAEHEDAERQRLAEDPCTAEDVARIKAEVARAVAARRARPVSAGIAQAA